MGDMTDLANERDDHEPADEEICLNCGQPWSLCQCDNDDYWDD